MRMRVLGLGVVIIATLGFSCHNEPNYPRPGMGNSPTGAGSGPGSITSGGPPAAAAPTTPAPAAPRSDSNKSAAKKR